MIEDTIKERTESYGAFTDNATVAQLLKEAIQMETNYPNMPPYMRESLDIICSKISRMVTGDFRHADNWRDIQGFAKLALDLLNAEDEPRFEFNEDCVFAEPLSLEKYAKSKGFWREGEWWVSAGPPISIYTMREMYEEHKSRHKYPHGI
tara:strand:+ start:1616 stop:2065 length:450 start_codon:yes stop_codon:yes gene_type:complete